MNKQQLKKVLRANTIAAAKALLGCTLVHDTPAGQTRGRIVETESYLHDDPACHALRGKTPRNAKMFEREGTAYVYFTYGMHWCVNVVTRERGVGEAILIRAIEPTQGIKIMQKRRRQMDIHKLCNGPAKLCQAMGITKSQNGIDLLNAKSPLRLQINKFTSTTHVISSQTNQENQKIITTTRIGIVKGADLPLRFYLANSKFVSRK